MKIGIFDLHSRNNVLCVDLWYPQVEDPARTPDHPVAVQVGLTDVRSADDIRIKYDFERDGWVIEQATWSTEDECFPNWQEVAFVQAWALERAARAKCLADPVPDTERNT